MVRVADVVAGRLLADDQRLHVDRRHEVGRAEDDRLDPRADALAIASTAIRPCAFSICASMPIRPTSSPIVFSIWVSSMSSATTWSALCTFGSMMQSRFAPGALDDLDDVAVGPVRRPVVDPDDADLVAPAALVQRRDDVLARLGLGQRRAGVLEVEEHLVGVGRPFAFSRKRGLLPGTARQERRGRRRFSHTGEHAQRRARVTPTPCRRSHTRRARPSARLTSGRDRERCLTGGTAMSTGDARLRRAAGRHRRLRPQRRPARARSATPSRRCASTGSRRACSAWSSRCSSGTGSSCRWAGSPASSPTRSCCPPAPST